MADEKTPVPTLPNLNFRRVQCEHEGRGPSSPRLKDMYIAPLANGQGWLITNFSGAMIRVPGLCPLPERVKIERVEDELVVVEDE